MSQKAILFDFHFRSTYSWQSNCVQLTAQQRVIDGSTTGSSDFNYTLLILLKKTGFFGSKTHTFQLCPMSLIAQSLWPLRSCFFWCC